MKLLLTKDVKDIGKAGELINASEGYARNFLLPRKLAVIADTGTMKTLDAKKEQLAHKEEKLLNQAKLTAEKIGNVVVHIKSKTGTGTKLYGSITNHEIAAALAKEHKITVDKRKISISEPIKTTGNFDVPIKLHHDVIINIKVQVSGIEVNN